MGTAICVLLGVAILMFGALVFIEVREAKRARDRHERLSGIIERNMKHDRDSKK